MCSAQRNQPQQHHNNWPTKPDWNFNCSGWSSTQPRSSSTLTPLELLHFGVLRVFGVNATELQFDAVRR